MLRPSANPRPAQCVQGTPRRCPSNAKLRQPRRGGGPETPVIQMQTSRGPWSRQNHQCKVSRPNAEAPPR
eukprot:761180-Lingulodinium_polyedra.AAC.1